MKGLLIKDLMLLKNQFRFFGVVILIMILFMTMNSDNEEFVVMYGTIMFSMFSLSTISYDEYDNGAPYLFSLPITRSGYVKEKYFLGLILALVPGMVIGAAVILAVHLRSPETDPGELIFLILSAWCITLMLQALLIPLQLKFGGEKGRTAMFLVFGILMILAVGGVKLLEAFEIDPAEFLNRLETVSSLTLLCVGGAVVGIALGISGVVSNGIMKKKDF